MNKIKKSFLLILTIGLLVVGGCSKDKSNKGKAKEKIKETIVYTLTASPSGVFNPTISNTVSDDSVNDVVYESLFKFDKNLNLVPAIAESYDVSQDGKEVTFKLKDNLKWSDGAPLTMDDVIFTFYSLASSDYTGPKFGNIEKVLGAKEYQKGKNKAIKGIEKLDNNKIKFTFEESFAPAVSKIGTQPIIPKHIWEKYPINTWKDQKDVMANAIGAGPFKIVEFKPSQYVKLERNENYSGSIAKTKYLILKEVNLDSIEVELKNGSVDIADISNLKSVEIEDLKSFGFNVHSYALNGIEYMGLNLRNPKLQDKKVRQALFFAIDRKMILDRAADGKGTLVNVPMLPSGKFYPKDSINKYEYNPELAKKMLEESGWTDRDGDGIIENSSGEKFEISLKFANRQNYSNYVAPLIQKNLKDIGIKLNLENMDFSAVMEDVVGNHNFDAYLMINMLPVDEDPKPYWHSTASSDQKGIYGWNISSFKNERADELLVQALQEIKDEKRKEIYKEFGVIMNDEVPWITFYTGNTMKAYPKNLKNFEPVTFLNMLDAENWYIEGN